MFQNYLNSAWRNFVRNKTFSLINLSGLTLGVTCALLIGLWIMDEYRTDSSLANLDRLYVVTSTAYSGTEVSGSYDTPGMLGETLPEVMPEVEYACSVADAYWRTLAVGDTKVNEPGYYADVDFFKIFSYSLIQGNAETALKDPASIVISHKIADLLFGSPEKAMNQEVLFQDDHNLRVTGVFEDLGPHMSQHFEYLISWKAYKNTHDWVTDWHTDGARTYLVLQKGANLSALEGKLRYLVKSYDEDYTTLDRTELGLQPYRETYLHSDFENGAIAGGRIDYVRSFGLVAIFVLLIACINFMNLSTARSIKRAKEIGVRKVIGAMRKSLVMQFLIESGLFTVTAVIISLLLVYLLLPGFNQLTGKAIRFPFGNGHFWIDLFLLVLFTALFAGSYPAFLLSSFRPLSIIKGRLRLGPSSGNFRKALVVLQFGLSMIFIVGTLVIGRQVDYMLTSNLGYEKNNLLYLPINGSIATNFDAFEDEALKLPGVESLCPMTQRPVEMENAIENVRWRGKDPSTKPNFVVLWTGYNYAKTMGITLLKGRDFSPEFNDSTNYIINEEALKTIGDEDPVGRHLTVGGTRGSIVGVMKNFYFDNMHVPISPLIVRLRNNHWRDWGFVAIRTSVGQTASVIGSLETLLKKLNPDYPLAIEFADQEYADMYRDEQIVGTLSRYFTFLAVIISCLGLLGLIMFSTEQRTREMGIRKVLGAAVSQIILLLAKDFIRLVALATLIASPLAWYISNRWLSGFAYRTPINIWEFITAAGIAVAIAMITIGSHAVKAARANPVESLKSE